MTTARRPVILTADQVSDPYFQVRLRLGNTIAGAFEKIGFIPYPKQLEILADGHSIIQCTGGIQGGKTHLASPILVMNYYKDTVRNPPFAREEREYWIAAHRLEDTAYEWTSIERDFRALGLVAHVKTDPAPMIILNDGWNTTIKMKFTADESKLSGVSPLGIIVCEGANVSKIAFDYLLGRTLGKSAWMYMSGTFEKNARPWWTAKYLEWQTGYNDEDAQSFSLASYDNIVLFPQGKDDPKIKRMRALNRDDDFYMERIEGIPVPPKGLVYPEFNFDLHLMHEYEYQEDQRLYLWHDPGRKHYCALLFVQYYGGVVYVFDEIYQTGLYTEAIIQIAQAKPWWKNTDKYLVSDPWYGGRLTAVAEYSIDDIWEALAGLTNMGQRHRLEDRIDRVKSILRPNPETGGPQVRFHSKNCHGILSEFGVIGRQPTGELHPYIWKIDDDGYRIGEKPIDRNNDALDAFGCGLMEMLGPARHAYDSSTADVRPVSTPESRGEYPGIPGTDTDEYGEGRHPSDLALATVSTPETRGEHVPWHW